jgi:hypothetical protein
MEIPLKFPKLHVLAEFVKFIPEHGPLCWQTTAHGERSHAKQQVAFRHSSRSKTAGKTEESVRYQYLSIIL